MSITTLTLIAAIALLATSIGLSLWVIVKHSRRAEDALQMALWRSVKGARE